MFQPAKSFHLNKFCLKNGLFVSEWVIFISLHIFIFSELLIMTMYCLYGLEIYIKSNTEFYIILFLMNIHGDAASETLASEPLR